MWTLKQKQHILSLLRLVRGLPVLDSELKNKLKTNKLIKIIEIKDDVPYVELIRNKTKDFTKSDYVFFLDPDEIVPSGLKIIIREKLDAFDYFKIPRKNITFGRWIRHSRWWPDYQVRLFKKDKVIWPKIIHRQPKVAGNGYIIEPKEEFALLHHNYQNIDEYLSKFQRYAKYEAKEIFESKHYDDHPKGLVTKNNLHQNKTDHSFISNETGSPSIILSTMTSLQNFEILKYLDIVTATQTISEQELSEFSKPSSETPLPSKEEKNNYTLKLADTYAFLAAELKQKALKKGGNAVIGITYQITPLRPTPTHKKPEEIQYKISCTGNIVLVRDVNVH